MPSIENIWNDLQAIATEGGWVFGALVFLAFGIAYTLLSIWNSMCWEEAIVLSGEEWQQLLNRRLDDDTSITELKHYFNEAGTSGLEEIERSLFTRPRRRIPFAFVLVGVAPLVGLLGTVSGMMTTFHGLAAATESTPIETISRGISEALITTQTGLIIGIPSFVVCIVLQSRLNQKILAFRNLEAKIMSSAGQ